MELHAFHGVLLVAQAHDGAGAIFFRGPGADFQFGGQIFFFHDQRVIAGGRHGHGKALKDGLIVVHDWRWFCRASGVARGPRVPPKASPMA